MDIRIPENVIESLLVAISTGDRNAITNIGAEIRQYAEDQDPVKFPTHRK